MFKSQQAIFIYWLQHCHLSVESPTYFDAHMNWKCGKIDIHYK